MKQLTSENFNSEIQNGKILVDFWASWCGPCRMLASVLEELDKENLITIAKVNVDDYPDIAKRFNIMSIPTLLLFENGNLKDTSVGFLSLEELKEFIK